MYISKHAYIILFIYVCIFFFFLRDFIFKKTLFEKHQYLKQEHIYVCIVCHNLGMGLQGLKQHRDGKNFYFERFESHTKFIISNL